MKPDMFDAMVLVGLLCTLTGIYLAFGFAVGLIATGLTLFAMGMAGGQKK